MAEPVYTSETELDTSAKPWLDLIKDSGKCFETYQDKCDNIDKQYAELKSMGADSGDREFAIFWANLEVMKPALYARPPVPVAVPAFKNYKELPRRASELLERSLVTSFRTEDMDSSMILVRDDVAIHSRGVLWLRYEADDRGERVCYDHIDRKDFRHEPARKWKEVGWASRREWLTREQMRARFEGVSGQAYTSAEYKERETDREDEYKGQPKCASWELWHKRKNTVVWVAEGCEEILDQRDPFLTLEGFFPCPRPAYGTVQRRSLIPVPDFLYYKDQVEEINEMTARISALAEALRVKGFYPGGASDLAEAIEVAMKDMSNNALLIPVSGFAALGGASLKESVVWLPVRDIAEVITNLVALRRQLIEDVYQITGLSDIMRGETDPQETLGAQELKSQYGSIRIRQKQGELVRVARDATRIAAEIMSENFAPETLLAMAQIDDLPTAQVVQQQAQQQLAQVDQIVVQAQRDPRVMVLVQQQPQLAQQAMAKAQEQKQQIIQQAEAIITIDKVMELLRSQRVRPFVLDIETDSTIQPDEDAEKQRRTEFITAVGGFIGAVAPVVQMTPEIAPLAAEMLKFLAAGFRAGRELEQAIEQFADAVEKRASQPQPPSPEAQKAQADAENDKGKLQIEGQKVQQDGALKSRELDIKEMQTLGNLSLDAESNQQAADKAAQEPQGNGASKPANGNGSVVRGMMQSQNATAEAIRQLAEAMKAPRKIDILRDEAGKATGGVTAPMQ